MIVSKSLKFSLAFFTLMVVLFLSVGCTQQDERSLLDKIKSRGKIIAGIYIDSPPFGFLENNTNRGYDVELIQEIAKVILGDSHAVEFVPVKSSTRIPALTSGRVDIVAATMTINDKRKQIIDFSNVYYVAGQNLMIPSNSSIESIQDLAGKTVFVALGSTSEKNIKRLIPTVNIKGFQSKQDAVAALKAGRGDAFTTDDTIIAGFIAQDPGAFKMLKDNFTEEPYGLGFRKSKDTQTFREAVNKIVTEMKENGELEKIRYKWMVDYISGKHVK